MTSPHKVSAGVSAPELSKMGLRDMLDHRDTRQPGIAKANRPMHAFLLPKLDLNHLMKSNRSEGRDPTKNNAAINPLRQFDSPVKSLSKVSGVGVA